MNQDYPHEIRRFDDGATIPGGYIELTQEEFNILNPMTPDERAAWLKENGRRDLFRELFVQEEDVNRVSGAPLLGAIERSHQRSAARGEKHLRNNPPLPPVRRQHRSQGR
ncbi:MAG: hypothetical protein DRI46_12060 [Chloroflexi bacterium]|nr:MAG: hypothetical protein DRI46_12060 [Chloroflexota bacterium]